MLHHATRGSGSRPVVLLHGFLGSGRNLGGVARGWEQLDATRHFLLVDLLGHGRSPPLRDTGNLEDMARAVLEWMEAQSLGADADVVGHSLGGRVALQARLLDPTRIGRVGLLDIRPGPIVGSQTEDVIRVLMNAPAETDDRDTMRRALEGGGLSRGLADWLLMSGNADADGRFRWRIDRANLERFHRENRSRDLWPAIGTASTTICLRGDQSPYVRDEDMTRFESQGVSVDTIKEAGHFLHAERTNEVCAALARRLP